jgi:hypothetical protein
MDRVLLLLWGSYVLWAGFWDYIWIVRIGGFRFGRGDYGDDLVGGYGCVINGIVQPVIALMR